MRYWLITTCFCLTACSSPLRWAQPDGTVASAHDLAECRQEANRNALNRQLAQPIEISRRGSIQPPASNSQNGFQQSQINHACLVEKGYQQISVEQ